MKMQNQYGTQGMTKNATPKGDISRSQAFGGHQYRTRSYACGSVLCCEHFKEEVTRDLSHWYYDQMFMTARIQDLQDQKSREHSYSIEERTVKCVDFVYGS